MKYNPKIVIGYFASRALHIPEIEFRFHDERQWRFDFAWPFQKVYLEVDGGIWIAGGHNRGAQIKKDWEKRNAATILGWRGLWCEPKDLCTVDMAEIIRKALG